MILTCTKVFQHSFLHHKIAVVKYLFITMVYCLLPKRYKWSTLLFLTSVFFVFLMPSALPRWPLLTWDNACSSLTPGRLFLSPRIHFGSYLFISKYNCKSPWLGWNPVSTGNYLIYLTTSCPTWYLACRWSSVKAFEWLTKASPHETLLIIIVVVVVVRCKEVKENKYIQGNILLSCSIEFSSKLPGSQAKH